MVIAIDFLTFLVAVPLKEEIILLDKEKEKKELDNKISDGKFL